MTPPWLPLLMVVVLLGVIAFLYWSMRRNLHRIDFEEDANSAAATPDSTPSSQE